MPPRKKKGKSGKSGKKGAQGAETVEILLTRAETCLVQFQFDEAVSLLKRALSTRPQDTTVMDTLAQAYMELGDANSARELLQKSAQLAPDAGHSKWLDLGQLSQGQTAIQSFQKAVDLMMKAMHEAKQAEGEDLPLQISTACCSMAEIYVTDLCDEPSAEQECERLLRLAVSSCERNPEAYAAMANLRLIQGRMPEAKECVTRTLQLYATDEEKEMGTTFEPRINCAKMCVELQMWAEASRLLEGLLQEDDRFVEIWFLAGLSYRHIQEFDTALQCLKRAEEMMEMSMKNAASADKDSVSGHAMVENAAAGEALLQKIRHERSLLPTTATVPEEQEAPGDDSDDEEMGA